MFDALLTPWGEGMRLPVENCQLALLYSRKVENVPWNGAQFSRKWSTNRNEITVMDNNNDLWLWHGRIVQGQCQWHGVVYSWVGGWSCKLSNEWMNKWKSCLFSSVLVLLLFCHLGGGLSSGAMRSLNRLNRQHAIEGVWGKVLN